MRVTIKMPRKTKLLLSLVVAAGPAVLFWVYVNKFPLYHAFIPCIILSAYSIYAISIATLSEKFSTVVPIEKSVTIYTRFVRYAREWFNISTLITVLNGCCSLCAFSCGAITAYIGFSTCTTGLSEQTSIIVYSVLAMFFTTVDMVLSSKLDAKKFRKAYLLMDFEINRYLYLDGTAHDLAKAKKKGEKFID